jgi:hypothetical protein
VQGGRQSEDHMKVFGGQQFCSALLKPAFARRALTFGAVAIAAGTVANMRELTVVAPFDSAAQDRRAAGLDGFDHAVLIERQTVSLPVCRAVLSKDVGQLQRWLGQSYGLPLGLRELRSTLSSGLTVAAMTCGPTCA